MKLTEIDFLKRPSSPSAERLLAVKIYEFYRPQLVGSIVDRLLYFRQTIKARIPFDFSDELRELSPSPTYDMSAYQKVYTYLEFFIRAGM